jgi:hypothetical protein
MAANIDKAATVIANPRICFSPSVFDDHWTLTSG